MRCRGKYVTKVSERVKATRRSQLENYYYTISDLNLLLDMHEVGYVLTMAGDVIN